MKSVKSTIVLNKKVIKQLEKNAIKALEMTGDFVLDQVVNEQVIPFDTGTLQNESTYVNKTESNKGSVKIVSSTPYARRLYFHPEYNFQHEKNPNAKAHWFEDWADNGKEADKVKRFYSKAFKRLGGL